MAAPEVRRRPAGRYDEPSRATRAVSVVAAAALAVGLLALAYGLYERRSGTELRYQVGGYEVLSDTEVRVSFTVVTGGTKTGLCRVRARSADGLETGSEVIPVGPGTDVSYVLTTRARAVTGEVSGCRRTTE